MAKRTNSAVWMENQNRWQINVQKDGVRRSFTSSTPGRTGQREANAKADAWLDDGITNSSLRVSECIAMYIEAKTGTVAIETIKSEKSKIDNWIIPYVGHKKISVLAEGDLQTVLNAAGKKGLSKKYITNIKAIIVQFLKYCRRYKYTTLNPEFLEVPKSAPTREKRILQPDAIKTLFSKDTKGDKFDSFVYAYRFAVLTGIRPGELLGLRWDDIVGDVVMVKRSINKDGRETTGKNNNARRSFVMTELAQETIKAQRTISDGDSVFGIRNQSTFRHRWQEYCEANNIDFVSLYELRHTFVSVAKGLSDGELRQLVGHSKNMDTYGVYSHELTSDKQKTAEKLDRIWSEIIG